MGIVTNPAFGALSDWISRRPPSFGACTVGRIRLLLFFLLMRTATPALVVLSMAIRALLQPMFPVSGSFYRNCSTIPDFGCLASRWDGSSARFSEAASCRSLRRHCSPRRAAR